MQMFLEDFLQYLRHERGQLRGINAETQRPQRIAEAERMTWERGIYAASPHERTEASDKIWHAIRFGC